MATKIEISHKTIIFTAVFLVALWFLLQIRDILFLLFISFILSSAMKPFVDWLENHRLPRILGVLLIYGFVFGVVGVFLAGIIPSLVIQSSKFFQALPLFVSKITPYWNIDVNALSQQIAPIGENIVKITVGIFSNLITTVMILVFTFYFMLERRRSEQSLAQMVGEAAAKKVLEVVAIVEQRLGTWVLGQLILMLVIGIFSYIGLMFLRVDYALPLAIIAGLLEIVPNVGPIISAIPAIIVALSSSPLLALSVVALYFIIHQSEGNLIVPMVMRKSVGLSPLVTIVALMVGGKLAGIVGAILAVPLVLTLQVVIGSLLPWSASRSG